MACAVYCLVPRPEQLDTLVKRLIAAGVDVRDIAVVPGRHWPSSAQGHALPQAADAGQPAATEADAFTPVLWKLSLASAALWWRWAGLAAGGEADSGSRDGHGIISLAQYEAGRPGKRRR